MPKHNTNSIHTQRLKAIRKYVNFDYDLRKPLSKYQKSKIKKYFDAMEALTARPNQVYRPRSKKHLKTAQRYSQHPEGLPAFKVAFVPNSGTREKIAFHKDGTMVLRSSEHITREVITWNMDDFLNDPYLTVEQAIEDSDGRAFSALCGEFERTTVSSNKKLTPETIAKLASRYSADNGISEDANNHHKNWLFGIAAYKFDNQADFGEYSKEKNKAKKDHKDERRKKRDRVLKCKKCGYKGKRKTFKKGKCPKCGTAI